MITSDYEITNRKGYLRMRLKTARFIAILILVIPGLIAMTGFLWMKDAIFIYVSMNGDDSLSHVAFNWLMFLEGLGMFIVGMGFLGGWIYSRDRKNGYGKKAKAK